jgi:SAM-dependent methyltransferase
MSALRRSSLTLFLAAFSVLTFAQAQKGPAYEPTVGQEGKDVVWVPTPQALVDKMLDMAKVTPFDFVMDLGSGDGRTVITAAKRGARAAGIEYNPDMVALSKQNAEKAGVGGKVSFTKADLFETDLSHATVITMFLLPSINLKLRPKLLELKPGTRIVSNSFTMDEWKADETFTLDEATCGGASWCTALLWIVPARVAGSHKLPQGDLTVRQNFQILTGTLRRDGKTEPILGRMNGEEISFKSGGREYHGTASGGKIQLQ